MQRQSGSRSGVLQWVVVLVVGILVVTVVLGLNLISRLNDGQTVLNAAKPAFTPQNVAGARAGIDIISTDVDTADPIMNPQGGAAAEVPKLVAFVSQKTGLSQPAVLAALQRTSRIPPRSSQTIPLSAVTAELPGLFAVPREDAEAHPAPAPCRAQDELPRTHAGDHQPADGHERLGPDPEHQRPHTVQRHAGEHRPRAKDVLQLRPDSRPRATAGQLRSLNGTSSVYWIPIVILIAGLRRDRVRRL